MPYLENCKNTLDSLLISIWKKVLKIENIDIQDEFISLGGNSLNAIKIIHKINELLIVSLPLDVIFKYNTIEKLSDFLKKQIVHPVSLEITKKRVWKGLSIPLSASQLPLYFLAQQNDTASIAYQVPLAFEIKGQLNITVLEQAIKAILRRHDVFHLSFKTSSNGISQYYQGNINITLAVEDIEKKELEKNIYLEIKSQIFFDFAPLLRVKLLRLSEQSYFLIITKHHIITDAWSTELFKDELEKCYTAFLNGTLPQLIEVQRSYADFIYQQSTYLNSEKMANDSSYWCSKLNAFTETTFPADFKRPTIKKFKGKRYRFRLNKEILEKIKHFNSKNNTTSFMLVSALLSLLLGRYTRQEDVIIGFPVSGRGASEFSHTMGLFLNVLALRSHLQEKDNFLSFLQRVKQDILDAYAHQNFPFSQLVKQLNVLRCQNKNPLFQIMLVWQDSADNTPLILPDMTMTPRHVDSRTSKFDLTFEFIPSPLGIDCSIEYDTDLYKKSTIERLSLHFINLLVNSLAHPRKNIFSLQFITHQEKEKFLETQALCKLNTVTPTTLHTLFEEQVRWFPRKTAVRFAGQSLTYKELNEQSNQLAYYIRQRYSEVFTSRHNPLLGVCLDRSINLIVALLATLKAGAAYVPLDPAWPQKRLESVLKDANCSIVLIDSLNKTKFDSTTQNLVIIDEKSHGLAKLPSSNLMLNSNAQDLMYVIYTSGTTGVPKGVPQTHYNVVRLLQRGNELFKFKDEEVWVLFHSYTFDFSVWEMWGALRFGSSLVIPSYQETRDPALFYQLVLQTKVTILNQTPSAFQLFMQVDQASPVRVTTLKTVIFGGEALNIGLLVPWWKRYSENHPTLVNMYGITETTVHTTFKFLTKKDLKRREFSNIGEPLCDIKAYVVDSCGQLVPIGVPGELLLSGFGLSPGYLNRHQLNNEKFIKNNFNKTLNTNNSLIESVFSRLYKTGDLVRYLSDGSLEYLGRIDKQLKIKGFRLEAGEIENAIQKHKAVKQCLVKVLQQNNLTALVAYYIPTKRMTQSYDEKAFNIELRNFLSTLLPHYAIPNFFIKIGTMPLTRNMKIDYAALPLPSADHYFKALTSNACKKTQPECILAEIWQSILKIASIDKDDNFFSLGGDSITSILVVTQARKKGFSFSVSDLFNAPTIRSLSKYYKEKIRKKRVTLKEFDVVNKKQVISEKYLINPESIEDIYPLSALQAGMVYHSSYSLKSAIYLDIFCFTIAGPYNKVCLTHSVYKLIHIHPLLRTSYLLNEFEEAVQIVHKNVEIPFFEKDLSLLPPSKQTQQIEKWVTIEKSNPFNYEKAPLFRIMVHILDKKKFVLGISFHHSILDGWSLARFITELLEEYSLQLKSPPIASHSKDPLQHVSQVDWNFKEFVQRERETFSSRADQLFWKKELLDFEITEIPRNNTLSSPKNDFSYHRIQVDNQVTVQLIALTKSFNISLDQIILAAHLKLLSSYSGREDVLSGVVFNGRPSIDNIDKTLGLFLNTLPFRINIPDCTWRALIELISEKKHQIYPHRRYPIMKILQDVHPGPLFNIIFYFTHFHVYKQLKANGPVKLLNQTHYERTNFPLAINCALDPVNKTLEILFNYETQHYSSEQISDLAENYHRLLKAMVKDIDVKHNTFELLTAEQKHCLLIDWNQTEKDFQKNKRTHELIEEVAKKFPEKMALIFEETSISYHILNSKANQLADYINSKTLTRGNRLVGLYVDRSLEAIIAMLAIWKSGKAYIPIDPLYPKERVKFILNDAQCYCLLSKKYLIQDLSLPNDIDILYLEELNKNKSSALSKKTVSSKDKENLAYVIYTSGSTGMPKGVMIEHTSLLNLLYAMQKKISFTENDIFLALTSFAFDISILEIFLPLITGGTCLIANQSGSKDPQWIKDALKRYPITVVQATASKWALLFEYGLKEAKCPIRALCGGEALPNPIASQLTTFAELAWNVYGPTETTIWSTIYKLSAEAIKFSQPPIGMPLANTKVYVLDKKLQPVPLGVIGDLYISGAGLARGYLNRSDLTAERFIKNPFVSQNSIYSTLYKTGDLARWLPNGYLDYINRSDNQIKIRGFRVEAGEVEYALLQHKAIKSSVVLLKEQEGMQFLVAFLVKKKSIDLSTKQLREFLAQRLPYYCIPDKYVFLEKLPKTQNEKLDRRQLMNIKIDEISQVENGISLSTEQLKLGDIWKKVLSINSLSLSDNFFELGGNSLSALRLVNEINKVFSIMLEIKEIIEHPVLSTQSDRILFLKDSLGNKTHKEETIDFVKSISDPIVKLKEGGSKTPLFLIHPVGGNVFYYIPLVKSLTNDRPIYAIQDPGIRCRETLFESLNDMASFYIKVIKKYQPKGPYLIAGSSFGANAAVEMARQLIDQGDTLAFIGLIDGWAKYPKEANDNREWFCQNLINQLKTLDQHFSREDIPDLLLDLHWHRQQLLVRHILPNMSDIQLTLFKAKQTMDAFKPLESVYNNWDIYCQTTPIVYPVSGDHFTMHFPPHHESLVKAFRDCLSKIKF